MKKAAAILLILFCAFSLAGCVNGKPTEELVLIEGSEETYCGTVIDRAMAVVYEEGRGDRGPHRVLPYMIITTDDHTVVSFWVVCDNSAAVGDRVTVESAMEEKTNLRLAIRILPE